jgi:signal transduction histidine kinase/DNA-binding response OmpR family regulator
MTDLIQHEKNTPHLTMNVHAGYELLIIEDNLGDARFLQLMLEEADFPVGKITHKMTLTEGISIFHKNIDAVFLDLSLPDSRGFETLQRFLAEHPYANVIVMTGFSDREMGIRAVKAGAQDFIIKGEYEPDGLVRSLYYSIERCNILKRLEETQRIVRVGSWEYNYGTKEVIVSDDFFKIIDTPLVIGKKFTYKDVPNYKSFPLYDHIKTLTISVYEQYAIGNKDIVKKEILVENPNTTAKFFEMQAYIARFQDGQPVLHGVVQDITEQKLNDQLRKEKELAEESAQLKEVFITNVSHEMRTPMNAILGMSNILLNTQMSSEQLECVTSIQRSSTLLLGIVNDILEISSLQNGKISYEYKEFDLQQLLSDLADVMQYKLAEKEMLLNITVENEVPKILIGDALRLNQVLYNLVGNAIKFTDYGHINVGLKTITQEKGDIKIQFEIQDTGIGIPEDKLDTIFDTFARIRSKNRLYEGTGLGLSIAKNIVVQRGGKMWVESEVDKGSTFYFTMSFGIAKNQEEVEKVNKYKDLVVNPDYTFRLLLVEDNKLNQLVAKKTLEKQWKNITLKIADHGQHAVEILEKEHFDIILMDIQMPIMDGYEATDYIRTKMPERSSIPILAMTAFAHISKEDKFKEFGLDDFVLKPFDPDDFYHKVAIYSKNK